MVFMSAGYEISILAVAEDAGKRLDVLVSSALEYCSRSYLTDLIQKGFIVVHGKIKKPGYRIKNGDYITGIIPPPSAIAELKPEPVPLHIIYEDEYILVINKQPGLVVHPAPGHISGTLVNGLLHYMPQMDGIAGKMRPGIVHRLDKDTSGTMVIAKNDQAQQHLTRQFKERTVKKQYLALVLGQMPQLSGEIDFSIGRHPSDRKKMSIQAKKTRTALTYWQVKENYTGVSCLSLEIKTGRTHQIRVHLAAVHHPVLGDPVYGKWNIPDLQLSRLVKALPRQMLHSESLELNHPATNQRLSFVSPLPHDMVSCINGLKLL